MPDSPDSSNSRTHRWEPPPGAETLIGPGGPLELVDEPVLGVPTTVFKRRPPHLRAVLRQAAERNGGSDYLVFPDRTLTFADTAASAARIAAVLAQLGVEKGDRVAFAAANVPAYPVAWWATAVLGGIVSSLNGWWTPSELAYGIELSKPKVVLGDERRLERLREVGLPDEVTVIDLAELESKLGPGDDALPEVDIDEDDPVCLLFTSGTTGRPKAATLSHRNFVHCGMVPMLQGAIAMLVAPPAADQPPRPQPAGLMVSPLFHVSGALPLTMSPNIGQKLVFPPTGAWDEVSHLELTAEHRITGWSAVPTQFWRLLEHPRFDEFDVSCVQQLGGGGAVFAPELFRLMARKLPQARIGCGYGMSETLGSGSRLGGVTLETHPASVGAVEPLMEIQIRDEDDRPLPDGEVGQICLRGAAVFLGYWDDPAATAEALDDQRWYRTGDYGHVADGVLFLESRMRDLIIRGGENIYPIEIENRLVEHPDIADACVVGVAHRQLGQEVAAVVVLHEGATLDADGVRAWVQQELAGFKVPTHVLFREELPYNATGKVLKHQVEQSVTEVLATR